MNVFLTKEILLKDLEFDTVLLVDTSDCTYKIVVGPDYDDIMENLREDLRVCRVSVLDDEDNETSCEDILIGCVKIDEPVLGLKLPISDERFQTSLVEKIEVYTG